MFRSPLPWTTRLAAVAFGITLALTFPLLAAESTPPQNPPTRDARLSPDRAVTDHADASVERSLASLIRKTLSPSPIEAEFVLDHPGAYAVSSDLTLPENVTLRVPRGALINIAETATLTISGAVEAGPYRIFTGPGRVAGSPTGDFVRPQWWGTDRAALQAAVRFKNVYLGAGTFTIDGDVEIPSDTHISGEPGCRIVSTLTGNPHNYYGMLRTSTTEPVKDVTIDGVTFSNTDAVGLYGFAVNGGGGENITFTNCRAEGCGLIFGINVRKILIANNICESSTLDKLDIFDDHHDGIYLGAVVEDCIIKNNRILGRRCHGIAVVSEAVFPPTSLDPTREMKGKRIFVQGNTVASGGQPKTAGGIWFSAVQDCRVVANHVEEYGDVGIDFEGSRNCVADSNVLVNNNKNLAMYGNCKNITFSNNTVYMTRVYVTEKSELTSCAFMNSYSNGYPTITDLRNSDIFVTGNLFSVNTPDPATGWMGGIVAGTARRIYFRDNVFVNCRFASHFCHDLETIEVVNNTFFNDRTAGAGVPLFLAVAENDPEERQPTKNFIIRGNRFRIVDDANVPAVIQIATHAVIHDVPTRPFCDLNVVIENNLIQRDEIALPSVLFLDNYRDGHRPDMMVRCIVRNNTTDGAIKFDIPDAQRAWVKVVAQGNRGFDAEDPD